MNYCCKYIPSEEDYRNLEEKVKARDLNGIVEFSTKFTRTFHIGSQQIGYAFDFQAKDRCYSEDYSNVPWEDNLESLKEFLQRKDIQIYDDDRNYTFEEFWNEIKDDIYVDEKHKRTNSPNEEVKDGVRWTYCWFS